jgi:hypothetical protein
LLFLHPAAKSQDKPYFVTYSHDLEEPGELEIETKTALGSPDPGNDFSATAFEFEYGVRAWWTAELYLDGQTTANDSTIFTGYRIENRFRPLFREHWINPVLYVEYEDISGADKTMLEVVGHDGQTDLMDPNSVASQERKHEGELKLILSSNLKNWNISENFTAEKNFGHQPWEFGYMAGVAHPLRSAASGRECTFCAHKVVLGAEAYGGLGDTWSLTLHDTSHYVAPVVGWQLPRNMRLSFSPGWGLTGSSLDHIYRLGFAASLGQLGNWFRSPAAGRGDVH